METLHFSAGTRSKSDCAAIYTPGPEPLSVSVQSSVGVLFGKAITTTAMRVAAEFGASTGRIEIDDDGALDGTVAARAEAALRMAGFVRRNAAAPAPSARAASSRDRPRRARLYLPGNQPHFAINAGMFGADCLIFDLEDSVVPARKFEARILVRQTLEASHMLGDCEIIVRVNPLSGPYGRDDLAEIVPACPHVILLPKCESADGVGTADREISSLEEAAGIPRGTTFLMPLIETARGVLAAKEIAVASPRNVALCFGREDFTRDIHAVPDPGGAIRVGMESLLARQIIVLSARTAGIEALDSVFSDVEDEEGLMRSCTEARALGFSGKGVLHPVQIPVVRRAFRPAGEEVQEAEKIVAAFETAAAEGRGAISVDGKMVDAPVVERARRVLREFAGEE